MAPSEHEAAAVAAIAERRSDLVELLSALIRFDTTARAQHDPPRQEAALQGYLADRLAACGAQIDLWEPDLTEVADSRMLPAGGLRFDGRPQLAARFAGTGGGRSLILCGHIDVVAADGDAWTTGPNDPHVRDGRLYGRGACDMKGGVAAMVCAAEVLQELGIRLRGDLTVNTVTDEESFGAGGLASVAHGLRADGCLVPEPTGGEVWVACRGSLMPTVTVEGRRGHTGAHPDHHSAGGPVNAIDKAMVVLDATRRLQEEWRERPDHRHPYLWHGDIVPAIVRGGDWAVTYPASCSITYHVAYLPAHADADGWGTRVEHEIENWIARAAASDAWLAEHPPKVEWSIDVPPAEVPDDHPLVVMGSAAAAEVGLGGELAGMDSWHDGATYTRFASTPAICLGPGALAVAHTTDEYVPVDELVRCAQAIALTAIRFCGSG